MTNHDRFREAFKDWQGKQLLTEDIIRILLKRFPEMSAGSILPNDHGDGNKSPCWCAGTENRIFDKIGRGLYRVRVRSGSFSVAIADQEDCGAQATVADKKGNPRISQLWNSPVEQDWRAALSRYWRYVKPQNIDLEKELDNLDITGPTDIGDWYDFLLNKYFVWKYTSPNRYASTSKLFMNAYERNRENLDMIVNSLFSFDLHDIGTGLGIATRISGLGTAGASGLLSLLFPRFFGTVDQFVVKALRAIETLPRLSEINRMKAESLTISDGILLTSIMRDKKDELNALFQTTYWTPRKIDMILWASRQSTGPY